MFRKLSFIALVCSLFAGCASVPMESAERSAEAQKFNSPGEGMSGLYIYRFGSLGGSQKKDVWIDGKGIGETGPNVFFYEEVEGDKEHNVSTESEFSPNDLPLKTKSGMVYFIRQYIKLGVFVYGAGLELVDQEEGKEEISELNMAAKGTCSK